MRKGLTEQAIETAIFNPRFGRKVCADDAADAVLMECCASLAAVGNRALCPKELAELCMKRGWTCNGSQPFAIISSVIRAHLRRRQISTSNASNGLPPGPGLPAPLFVSYELTGPVAPEDVEAIGIIKKERPAIKRGTLWYLSFHGTGYPSPFAPGRDPLGHLKHLEHAGIPPTTSSMHLATPPSPDRMPTRHRARHSFSYQPIIEEPDDIDSMGRGKRKRKASGIAGGDWESIALPSTTAANASLSVAAPAAAVVTSSAAPARILPRIAEEGLSARSATSPGPLIKLKLKLPALSDMARTAPALALPAALKASIDVAVSAFAPSSDDETADEMEEDGRARRKRLRFKPGQDVATAYRTPRPTFSASTSVFGDDSASEEEHEHEKHKATAEAINRAADFEFEFDHAFSTPMETSLEELGHLAIDTTAVSTPAPTPRFDEAAPKEALKKALEEAIAGPKPLPVDEDTAEESAGSADSDDAVAAALKVKERKRAASAGALDAPPNINETLCPERPAMSRARSHSSEGIPPMAKRASSEGPPDLHIERRSPAPELPVLSVETASVVFSPSSLQASPPLEDEPPCQTPYTLLEGFELGWRDESDSHATSPSAAAALSPRSVSEEGQDYFDAEAASMPSRSVSPFHQDEDTLSQVELEKTAYVSEVVAMDLDVPELAGLDILDREFGPNKIMPSIAPTSFGTAATFFSFLSAAAVPVAVVNDRRDSSSSSEAVETSEDEVELPPARSTRSATRARQPPPLPAPTSRKKASRRLA